MADKQNNVLDLQQLFGQSQSIKVKCRDGKTYELMRMDAITPKEAVRFQKLQVRASSIQKAGQNMSNEQAADLTIIFDELLSILCKDLPLKQMEYLEKVTVINFYMEQTQGKKTMDRALRNLQTGGKRSRR